MAEFGIGQSVRRIEDPRLLSGQGNYLDDVNLPRQAHAVVLRSPVAHARIRSIDTSAALQAPGVLAVFTGADVEADDTIEHLGVPGAALGGAGVDHGAASRIAGLRRGPLRR